MSDQTESETFQEAVRGSIERRLADKPKSYWARPRPTRSGVPIRPWLPAQYGYHFVGAELTNGPTTPLLTIRFSWLRNPLREDTAVVDMDRFLIDGHRDDAELCASLIVQELEEDLCSGETPDSRAADFQDWGVRYTRGS
jgi:hypothetical protein